MYSTSSPSVESMSEREPQRPRTSFGAVLRRARPHRATARPQPPGSCEILIARARHVHGAASRERPAARPRRRDPAKRRFPRRAAARLESNRPCSVSFVGQPCAGIERRRAGELELAVADPAAGIECERGAVAARRVGLDALDHEAPLRHRDLPLRPARAALQRRLGDGPGDARDRLKARRRPGRCPASATTRKRGRATEAQAAR